MKINLLRDKWLPVLLESGRTRRVAPWEIADGGDPPVDLVPPRPDFRLTLFELLIGLVQTACPPENVASWRKGFDQPPAPEELQKSFEPLEEFFELFGEGPRFMQDLDLDPDTHAKSDNPIGALLIGYPGGGNDTLDLFVKADSVGEMCPACAAMALQTMQAFAPSGGRGNRTSIRGGGPLTTLMQGQNLWRTIWGNVLALNEAGVEVAPAPEKLPGAVLPWAAPTRTSEKGQVFRRKDGHFLHHYWGMPRRILLLPREHETACDVCGESSQVSVNRFIQRPSGYNYGEDWLHPLTPYRRKGQDEFPYSIKGTANVTGYGNWLGLVFGDEGGGTTKTTPAACVVQWRKNRKGRREMTMLAGGFDLDKMKARQWCEGAFPVPAGDPESLGDFRQLVASLVQCAYDVRSNLLKAVRKAVFHDKNPSRSKALGSAAFEALSSTFWADTSEEFYAITRRALETASSSESRSELQMRWARFLDQTAARLFERAAGPELTNSEHARRAARALDEMHKFNQDWFKKHFGETLKRKGAAA